MKRERCKVWENLPMHEKNLCWCEMADELVKQKVNIGIDKLRLCYNIVDDRLIRYLEENKPDYYDTGEGFELRRIEGKGFADMYQILIRDYNKDNELETVVAGKVYWNLKEADDDDDEHDDKPKYKKAWISVENKMLYSSSSLLINFFSQNLGLEINNLTELEIYIDSTKKHIPNLLKRIIRCKDLKVYLNCKEIRDRDKDRPEISYIHSGNLNKYKYLSVYIQSVKAIKNKLEGVTLCAYNKLKECGQSEKNYILDTYGNPKQLYRTEIRVGNLQFREFLNANRIELSEHLFYKNKAFKGFLFETFVWFCDKVLYFKDNNNKKFGVADILL
jgi:hypothetical protein